MLYFLAAVAVLQFLALLVLIFLLDRLRGSICTVERTFAIFLEEIRRTEERPEVKQGSPALHDTGDTPVPTAPAAGVAEPQPLHSIGDFVSLERDGVVLRIFPYSSDLASSIGSATWSSSHHYLRHRGACFHSAQEWERHRKRLRVAAIA